jgi:ferredoxin-NADP reductase
LAVRWFGDPHTRWVFPASAAAKLLLAVVAASIVLWHGAERLIGRWALARLQRGVRHRRSYSLSAPPRADGSIEITVAELEGGRVSPVLACATRIGDVLELSAPYGGLCFPVTAGAPALLLAAGSGITPLRALLLDALAKGETRPITLLYWAQTRDELCFRDELLRLSGQKVGRVTVTKQDIPGEYN